jgi:hypothetical protein
MNSEVLVHSIKNLYQMKKILFFAGVMFLSTAILTSCGAKDEKKDDDKKDDKKEEAKEDEEAEAEAPTAAWSQDVQDAYVNSCFESAKGGMKEDVAKEYCNCTLGKIMAKYPDPTELQNLGQDEITSLAMECMTAEMMTGQ